MQNKEKEVKGTEPMDPKEEINMHNNGSQPNVASVPQDRGTTDATRRVVKFDPKRSFRGTDKLHEYAREAPILRQRLINAVSGVEGALRAIQDAIVQFEFVTKRLVEISEWWDNETRRDQNDTP